MAQKLCISGIEHKTLKLCVGSLLTCIEQWETWVRSLGWEDSLEEGMAIHSSILAWRIPMNRGV